MDDLAYWQKQLPDKPLFPDIEWSKPEHKARAGKLGIVGGNQTSFVAVAESYAAAKQLGVGEVRLLLPDVLKKSIPSSLAEASYGCSNSSGGLSKKAEAQMMALANWSTGMLLIGDTGGNSETAILYEKFLKSYNGPLVISRDAIDLMRDASQNLVGRDKMLIIASFSQLQKLFQEVYYPKILISSMQLTSLVENVHKFTITYPIAIAVFFQDNIIVAAKGEVTSTPWHNPMDIWRGRVATKAAAYWLWSPNQLIESVTTSLIDN